MSKNITNRSNSFRQKHASTGRVNAPFSSNVIRVRKMRDKNLTRMVIRWGSLIGAIVIAALYLNSSIYSAWISGGPPNNYPEAWAHRALMHLCFSAAFLFVGIAVFRIAGSYPHISGISLAFGVAALLIASIPYARSFLDSDACLDSGGRWDYGKYRCEK